MGARKCLELPQNRARFYNFLGFKFQIGEILDSDFGFQGPLN